MAITYRACCTGLSRLARLSDFAVVKWSLNVCADRGLPVQILKQGDGLAADTISARDENRQCSGPLIPIVQIAPFREDEDVIKKSDRTV